MELEINNENNNENNVENNNENNVENKECDKQIYDNLNYSNLEKLRKTIEILNSIHHIEIAKILKKNNIKLTENNNGIFINLNNLSSNIIEDIKQYINFIKTQESLINIDESKKEKLENIYFKSNTEL